MMRRLTSPALLFSLTALVALSAAFAACATGSNTGTGDTQGGGGSGSGTGGAGGEGGGIDDDGGLIDVSQPDSTVEMDHLIYAHTGDTLYSLDPKSPTLALKPEGIFDCVGQNAGQVSSMTDLAVDQSSKLWGISASAVHPLAIQNGVVHCGTPIVLNKPQTVKFFGLTFAPAGVLHPTKEVLVAGDTSGTLWVLDEQGNSAQRGTFGTVPANDGHGHSYPSMNVGKNWALSGDIVFLANNGLPVGFATVRDCSDPSNIQTCNTTDTLLELNLDVLATAGPQTIITKSIRGQVVKRLGCNDSTSSGYGGMYGIGAWNDKVYGFSVNGKLVEIETGDGSACLVKEYAGYKFAGAGVTTLAPFMPPPK